MIKLTTEEEKKLIKAIKDIPIKYGEIDWRFIIQDEKILAVKQRGGIETKKII